MSKFALSRLSKYLINRGFNQVSCWGKFGIVHYNFAARSLEGEVSSSVRNCMEMFERLEKVVKNETTDGYVMSVSAHKNEVTCHEPDPATLTIRRVQYIDHVITFQLPSDDSIDLPLGTVIAAELKAPTTSACMARMSILRDYLLD